MRQDHINIGVMGIDSSADNSVLSLYNLVTSTNYITINCFPDKFLTDYDKFLKDINFKCVCEFNPTEDKRHTRLRRYEHKELLAYDLRPYRIELFLNPTNYKATGITTKIFYPTQELIDRFISFFSSLFVMPHLSFVELTMDTFTNEPDRLLHFIGNHLFQKYNRFGPMQFKTTYYSSTSVKSRGMRCYIKDSIPGGPVRLELMLKGQALRGPGLTLPNLRNGLNSLDLAKYFDFRRFEKEKYLSVLAKRMLKQTTKEFEAQEPGSKRFSLEQVYQLRMCGCESYLSSHIYHDPYDEYLPRTDAGIYQRLKRDEKQAGRFFVKLDDFNREFFNALAGKKFL